MIPLKMHPDVQCTALYNNARIHSNDLSFYQVCNYAAKKHRGIKMWWSFSFFVNIFLLSVKLLAAYCTSKYNYCTTYYVLCCTVFSSTSYLICTCR